MAVNQPETEGEIFNTGQKISTRKILALVLISLAHFRWMKPTMLASFQLSFHSKKNRKIHEGFLPQKFHAERVLKFRLMAHTREILRYVRTPLKSHLSLKQI